MGFLGFVINMISAFGFCEQLGILNVVEAMELDPEVVYPIYLAASADW